jgi:hypothetical protein
VGGDVVSLLDMALYAAPFFRTEAAGFSGDLVGNTEGREVGQVRALSQMTGISAVQAGVVAEARSHVARLMST